MGTPSGDGAASTRDWAFSRSTGAATWIRQHGPLPPAPAGPPAVPAGDSVLAGDSPADDRPAGGAVAAGPPALGTPGENAPPPRAGPGGVGVTTRRWRRPDRPGG